MAYQHLFKLAPAFLIERMAKKNSNMVSKFNSQISSHMQRLTDDQKDKLDIILNSDVDDLQDLMRDAFEKSGLKQFKVLANPEYREFVELNLNEIRKMF